MLGILLMTVSSALMTLNAAIVKELGNAASVIELCSLKFGVQLVFNLLVYSCWACRGDAPSLLRTGRNWALLARVGVGATSIVGSYYAFRHMPLGKIFCTLIPS